MTCAVEVRDVRHRFGGRLALDGVSWEVATGELFGVIGPNGSGKSTAFSLLNTSRHLQEGAIAIGGVDVRARAAEVRRSIGIVFQRSTLDRVLTCRENLELHGALHGLAGAALRGRVEGALTEAGLGERARERTGALSGGLGRRLEVARALLHLPSVLLLDEPAGSLDPVARADLWSRLAAWRRERGLTVLVTTHDMTEAEQCDRLAVLDAGRVVAMGTPAELTRGLGAWVVTVRTAETARVAEIVRTAFSAAPVVVGSDVRFVAAAGHALVEPLAAACGPAAASITVGRPTLEDVFVARTGHSFVRVGPEGQDAASGSAA